MHHGCNRQETKLSVFCSMMIMLCLVRWEAVGTERLRAHMAFYVPALNAKQGYRNSSTDATLKNHS